MERFTKTVSKGSRFNQIYIPKHMENIIEVGDEVEVRLIRKQRELYYSEGLERATPFKEKLMKDAFSLVKTAKGVHFVCIVGSFLSEKIDYNDIDIVVIKDKTRDNLGNLEEEIYSRITEKLNLRFHILTIEERRFWHLLKICPLTRSMFSRFVCNKPLAIPHDRLVDKKHIQFLLMMPYDLLEITLSSRAFFDGMRRVITIERFLKNQDLDSAEINKELRGLLNERVYAKIRSNEIIEKDTIADVRKAMKSKLKNIEALLKNGKKE